MIRLCTSLETPVA